MKNFVQEGERVDVVAPSGGATSGVGLLIGTHLFGVATKDAAVGDTVALQMTGVVEIAKTSALVIAIGDLLYWDNTNKVVNKTATSQKLVGIAVSAAGNPSPTVRVLLLPNGVAIA